LFAHDEDASSLTRSDAQTFPKSRQLRRRLLAAALVVPLLVGLLGGPVVAPAHVNGDELSPAMAQQKALEKEIARQKALIAQLTASQNSISGQIASTQDQLNGITDDLQATQAKVTTMSAQLAEVKSQYAELVGQLKTLDAELIDIAKQEAAKKADLGVRKAQLADRVRQAYESQRTSFLEVLLSGASFTDMLAAMSSQLDAAEQDRELAKQINADRATLLALHQTLESTRDQTTQLSQQVGVQKQQLDRRISALNAAQAKLTRLEQAAKNTLASQQAQYAKAAADKGKLAKAVAAGDAARKKLQAKIAKLVAQQYNLGNIPSQYNGTLIWPMAGAVTQNYGCTGLPWNGPRGNCAHWHTGIDLAAPYGAPVRAAGPGRVVYVGWNYADGADPAWIVIIAHSSQLVSWYAHLQPKYPVRTGSIVTQGQVIGYEGNTGHSTGAHLHWMVSLGGVFVNPKLFT
jgi:murein DD-endopeptidase MepM/ murein hydrolase activator NlpD